METSSLNLEELRKGIDKLDYSLVQLLSERFKVTHQVGLYKREHGLEPIDRAREELLFGKLIGFAEELDVNPELVKRVFRIIVDEVIGNHKKIG